MVFIARILPSDLQIHYSDTPGDEIESGQETTTKLPGTQQSFDLCPTRKKLRLRDSPRLESHTFHCWSITSWPNSTRCEEFCLGITCEQLHRTRFTTCKPDLID